MRKAKIALSFIIILNSHSLYAKNTSCIEIRNPEHTTSHEKYTIEKPGNYCLKEDLHSRWDFADHSAEGVMVVIASGNVTLDLEGHTLGRGILFRNSGGYGILINEFLGRTALFPAYNSEDRIRKNKIRNVVIKNGTLQDFKVGIFRQLPTCCLGPYTTPVQPTYNPVNKTYDFKDDNISIKNIIFKRNEDNFIFEEFKWVVEKH